jgi:negative regulator of sigma E activity
MSEQEQISQLSALFDGELPSQQAEMVIRRALKDSAMRDRWQRYAVIGACVRGEPLAVASRRPTLADRVSARLVAEAEILAPNRMQVAARSLRGRGFGSMFGRGAMGGAIAAAAALVAVFVMRSMGPVAGSPDAMIAQDALGASSASELIAAVNPAADSGVAADSGPRSYTTPVENARAPSPMMDSQPLAHYVVAHSEQAASSFGWSNDLTQGAVDMTQDEIDAHLR